jgi:hypothetical protein
MTDFAKTEVKFTYSEESTYSPALNVVELPAAESEPSMHTYMAKVKADDGTGADGTGTKIDLAHWTTVQQIIVKNLGTAKVAAVFTVADDADLTGLPAPAEQGLVIHGGTSPGKGGEIIITNIDPAGDLELVALGTDTMCAVIITGTLP